MEKNDVVEAVCESIGTQGEGIAKVNGCTVFVPYLLSGEKAKIRILKVKNNVAYGKIEELLTPAEERVRPKCDVFYRCGGCQLQHCNYRTQIKFKTALVRDTLKKIGGIEAVVASCERSEKTYGYRNKLQLPVARQNGQNAIGFFAERSHRIVPAQSCPIHPDWSEKLIAALYDFMEKCGLDGYDEQTGKGQVRHIVVRELKDRFIVTLVVTEKIAGIDYFFYLLDNIFAEYSFYFNYNNKRTNAVFGDDFELFRGRGFYECTDGGIVFEAGANTFVQVNEYVRGRLYDRIVSLVNEDESVIDCYSGGGLLTAMLAKKSRKAVGIEIVPEASACADKVKERNGLQGKMVNYCGDAAALLEQVLESERDAVVVLDPPRAGVERRVIETLKAHAVKKILYVSCNPATLARDAGMLCGTLQEENGMLVKRPANGEYTVTLVEPYDMFPQTKHVETLLVLSKN
ncbi:MAG: 23S rRNA (uracil(1939)-C(5))-methyltransferase RlmD [Clostridia bacterium]|nr:23S rRNA (uracil(1939)-C(5))-methyltransferase RlmD [Clostridia bacterium]